MDLITLTGLRTDGRRPNELRRINLELGALQHVDGSCTLEQGNTRVSVVISGPKEAAVGAGSGVCVQASFAPFAAGERRKPRGGKERRAVELAGQLELALQPLVQTQLFARSRVDVQVTVLQTDGSVTSSAFNACVLALMDAGVPMQDFGVACTVALQDGLALLDPNQGEAAGACEVWVAVLPRSMHVLGLGMAGGKLSIASVDELMVTAQQGCAQVFGVLEAFVVKSVSEAARAQA
jgi:exosome complex component RRP41